MTNMRSGHLLQLAAPLKCNMQQLNINYGYKVSGLDFHSLNISLCQLILTCHSIHLL